MEDSYYLNTNLTDGFENSLKYRTEQFSANSAASSIYFSNSQNLLSHSGDHSTNSDNENNENYYLRILDDSDCEDFKIET
jgi:hypothetical protein